MAYPVSVPLERPPVVATEDAVEMVTSEEDEAAPPAPGGNWNKYKVDRYDEFLACPVDGKYCETPNKA